MYKSMSKRVIALVIIGSMCATTVASASEVKKDESVYVNLRSSGQVEKITVTNWLHSDKGNIDVTDKSNLSNIQNVKGEEAPVKEGDTLKWKTNSSDIYYKGDTKAELPLDVNIKYYLNDERVEEKDIAGKSGKIKIEIELKNNSYKNVKIGGKDRKIYTPLLAATVVTLPVDKFKDVTINEGTMVSEGNNNVVAFPACPGLKESLDLNDKDLDINLDNKLVIEGYTDNFELGPIMITATTELPNLDKIEKADSIDELKDSLNKLKDASDKLLEGTGALSDGIMTAKKKLDEGKGKLNDNTLHEAMGILQSDEKINRANKLIDDAYFAKNMNTDKGKQVLGLLTENNINNINTLVSDGQAILVHKGQIEAAVNTFKGLSRDDGFNKLLNDTMKAKKVYENVNPSTIKKLNKMSELATSGNLNKSQNLLKETLEIQKELAGVQGPLNSLINNAPGNNTEEKANNFLNGVNGQIKKTTSMINGIDSNKMQAMSKDVSSYGEGYLIFKGILAGDVDTFAKQGVEPSKALAMSKAKLCKYIDGVYGGNGAKLKALVNSMTLKDISKEGIGNDYTKMNAYGKTMNGLMKDVETVKGLTPVLDKTSAFLSKPGQTKKFAKFYSDINNKENQKLMNAAAEGFLSLNEEDLKAINSLKDNLMTVSKDIEENKENIETINKMVKGLKDDKELVSKIEKFSNDLNKSQGTIKQIENVLGNGSSYDIKEAKKMGEKLLSMQQDLKDSSDILRITKTSLDKNNVNRARELLNSLPSLEDGVNKLADGSQKLNDGMKKFNEEGIEKIYDKGNDGVENINNAIEVKDELVKMSKDYNTFSGKEKDMDGSVKFIMKTNEIKAPEKEKASVDTEENKGGFIDWLKGIFEKIFG